MTQTMVRSIKTTGKLFLFSTICHNPMVKKIQRRDLTIGDKYDIYKAKYFFTIEYEVFKDGEYYLSYVFDKQTGDKYRDSVDIENSPEFLDNFYNREQLRISKLNELGI